MVDESVNWDTVIKPQRGWWDLDLKSIWRYRDLVWLFVKRDFVTFYKQTILGPIWYILQPLFTTVVFTIIFGNIANISTEGTPPFLFYMAGTVCWNYFSASFTKSSNTFLANASIFGKVYFPRLIVPISVLVINFVQFAIQLMVFLSFYIFYYLSGSDLSPGIELLYLPLALAQMAILGLGSGILVSSLTTKYRDMVFALSFGVQLWMYATPVVYPSSIVPEKYLTFYMLNPMASVVELFRLGFFGESIVSLQHCVIGWIVTSLILVLGILMFNRIEKSFMDTV